MIGSLGLACWSPTPSTPSLGNVPKNYVEIHLYYQSVSISIPSSRSFKGYFHCAVSIHSTVARQRSGEAHTPHVRSTRSEKIRDRSTSPQRLTPVSHVKLPPDSHFRGTNQHTHLQAKTNSIPSVASLIQLFSYLVLFRDTKDWSSFVEVWAEAVLIFTSYLLWWCFLPVTPVSGT